MRLAVVLARYAPVLAPVLALTACAGTTPKDAADSGSSDNGSSDSGAAGDRTALTLAPAATTTHGAFVTAGVCAECHSNSDGADAMRDASGRPVGPFDLWQASAMANAARDPYWWAAVRAESLAFPDHAAEIEAECMTCHAATLVGQARLTGGTPALADLLGTDSAAVTGLDGATCTVCHQIEPDALGTEASWSGGWTIAGAGRIYGPYADPFTHPMEMHTDYVPTEGAHIRDSGLCATCHSLTTAAFDATGAPTGQNLHEQSPYQEWLQSDHAPTTSCQDCHVPQADEDGRDIATTIARNPNGQDFGGLDTRSPYGRHTLVGANAFLLGLLRDNRDVLNPWASAAAFDANIARARTLLASAAVVTIGTPTASDTGLDLPVTVTNLSGHKLPTGYPSRRVWLEVTITDASGTVTFRSGHTDTEGRILDASGAIRPEEVVGGPVYPHADVVADGEAQVWEAVMADVDGVPTFRLLAGGTYLRDDRLLPGGFGYDAALGVNPAGVEGDADFVAGGDTVHFRVPALESGATVDVALRYQTTTPRHLAELYAYDDPIIGAFRAMVEASDRTPETITTARATY